LVATGVVALAVDYIAFRPMRDRRPFSLAIASIGVAFVLENVVRFIWGNDFRSFDVPVTRGMSVAGLRIGREQLLILGVAVVLIVGVLEEVGMLVVPPTYKTGIGFAIILAVLLVRPTGLAGARS